MSRIPFIEARFFNPDETTYTLEKRFVQHLRDLRSRELSDTDAGTEQSDSSENAARRCHSTSPSDQERARIKCRVDLLLERRKAASGIGHLTREHRERLAVLRDGVRLAAIATEHQADELAAELHGEMPWMAPATEAVWHAMRRSVREGWPGLRLPPILLDGPPGIGKSHWARRLGQLLTVPTAVVEATSENASFGVVGSQRGWGSAHPGRLLETILQARVANPVLVVDEVEKAGKASSIKGHTFGLAEALLPLLEPMTAKRWNCPYYQVKFDMSWVAWVLTSNNYRLLPEPLLSRCPPVRLRTQPDDAFAQHTLAGAQDLLLRIEDEVRLNGGLPEIERDETGTAHMTGGTQASQRIQVLADHLRTVLEPAWKVHDRLLAEATVSAQRKRLAQTSGANDTSHRL